MAAVAALAALAAAALPFDGSPPRPLGSGGAASPAVASTIACLTRRFAAPFMELALKSKSSNFAPARSCTLCAPSEASAATIGSSQSDAWLAAPSMPPRNSRKDAMPAG